MRLVSWTNAWGGQDTVDLNPASWALRPWTENCEGCDGTGIAHQGGPVPGPCGSCWGLRRVTVAFVPQSPAALTAPARLDPRTRVTA